MKWLKPTLPMAARSRPAVPMAPLCEMKPMMPCAGMPGMKLALSFLAGRITPRQLGPMMRRPEPSKAPLICSSTRRPSSPSSRPPAAMMITRGCLREFALAHHLGRGGDGHGDDGQVGERRRVGDGAKGFEAVYLVQVGVHRQDGCRRNRRR